ncbi:hypothetical protein DPMN_121447 [Dreissena polymorpha]|uniref:Uncharacterized protein n=1 Tax=Dreissena polymorpha TaxID=45954 RepID=A0A9D4GQI4_DREPO|nr:hypothetical protein DPMN_121445 [Dreissena polymorpha]KAH3819704.1 hypothetical protein DPMN_121447 [Dreissena polymorpha]
MCDYFQDATNSTGTTERFGKPWRVEGRSKKRTDTSTGQRTNRPVAPEQLYHDASRK